jgi:hypothetical protein
MQDEYFLMAMDEVVADLFSAAAASPGCGAGCGADHGPAWVLRSRWWLAAVHKLAHQFRREACHASDDTPLVVVTKGLMEK